MGELRPDSRGDYITRVTAVAPAAVADCPAWLAFLYQVTGGDAELIAYLQRWFGYCLTGLTQEHALLFVYGPGGNGKGVLLNTVSGIMGAYAAVPVMDTFTASAVDRHPTDLAMLDGARLVITTETEEGRAWAEARLKALTGGDPITAHYMRRDNFTFTPVFKLTVSGNHMPVLRNVDDAARRRFNIVPFLYKPEQVDRSLPEKLRSEWPGILRWMIEGCLAWQASGLQQPAAIRQATEDYFNEQDLVGQWITECCTVGSNTLSATTKALFQSWAGYAAAAAESTRNEKWFSRELLKLGLRAVKGTPRHRGKRGFVGIALKSGDVEPHWLDRWQEDR